MELKNILTFLRAAELRSFTKVAQELGYTQSTITIQIKQLEKELGVLLFDRIGRTISLTPMGEEFVHYAKEIMRIALNAKTIGTKKPETFRGALRIGILESLFIWRFSDLIPRFHSTFPLVSIEAKLATGSELYHMLKQNDVDIIYVLDKKISQKDCVKTCVNSEKIVFITSPDNPLAAQKDIYLSEIVKYPLILAERIAIYRRELDEAAARQEIEFTPLLEVGSLEVILKLLKRKMGISFLPEYVVKESVLNGELILLDVRDCDISLCSQVVYHKNKWVTPQMSFLMELVRER
ncbi:LysR family transcriptional regulator [Synergistales bacterium]|nr:LysR family transcriptional regulator [Synergistales bacterium]